MRLFLAITAFILCVAKSATAYDAQYIMVVDPHVLYQREVEIPAGPTTIEVITDNQSAIDCNLLIGDPFSSGECKATLNMKSPYKLPIMVSNKTNRSIAFKIWVHDTK
jgi:hypothetical protein